MSKKAQNVEIQGRSYQVNCPAGQEQALEQAAQWLDSRITEMSAAVGPRNGEQLAIMAALNLSHELLLEQQKNRDYAQAMEKRIQLLQSTIEQALLEQGQRLATGKDH